MLLYFFLWNLKKVFCWFYQNNNIFSPNFRFKFDPDAYFDILYTKKISKQQKAFSLKYWLLSFLSLQIFQATFVSHLDWIECAIEPVSECVSDIARLANSGVRIGSALQLGIKISVQYFSNELFWYFNFRMVSNFWC